MRSTKDIYTCDECGALARIAKMPSLSSRTLNIPPCTCQIYLVLETLCFTSKPHPRSIPITKTSSHCSGTLPIRLCPLAVLLMDVHIFLSKMHRNRSGCSHSRLRARSTLNSVSSISKLVPSTLRSATVGGTPTIVRLFTSMITLYKSAKP